ncbi:hypothetical protein [Lichenifustis flavocetrariae]|uniref:Uncharacterized protein n=1 Tax=Lichenifustis flavocetrariae TaxID=2949735 RepID=A0AA41YQY4_9HYPH|nr:hypothetical protein [Lichenifustis flavocetrariae]MCW6506519.1 hypothetical protein [Lichenifustis flavocetrariae]
MRTRFLAAFGVGLTLAALPVMAQAQDMSGYDEESTLPPVSGTLHLRPDAYGYDGHGMDERRGWQRRRFVRAEDPRVFAGSQWRGGEAAYQQSAVQGYAPRYRQAYVPATRWATSGTGLVGLIGNSGNPFAGGGTGWGTADSATSGPGYATGGGLAGWATERPLRAVYGEPDVMAGAYQQAGYGAAPQLGYYSSGAPSTMPYYSSGSSAGAYGSPGGLPAYRSGSYGAGPRVIVLRRHAVVYRGCTCGPRIVRVGHRRRHLVWR